MTPDEAGNLEISGRYAEYLARSVEERNRANIEGRRADEALWCVHAARACRRIGKAADVLGHAEQAARLKAPSGLVHFATGIGLRCARRYDESLAALKEAVEHSSPEARTEVHLETAETALEAGSRPETERALMFAGTPGPSRLRAWARFLRAQLDDSELSTSLKLAQGWPELEWQILWRLSERIEEKRDDLIWCAVGVLAKMADPLEPEDATHFWKNGARRAFVDQAQRRFGPTFLHKIMMGGSTAKDPAELLKGLPPGS